MTGKQLADDFLLLQSMATQYNLSSFVLQAPDSCCAPFDRVLLEDFINTVSTTTAPSSSSSSSGSRSALSQASFHLYSNPSSCSPAALIDSKHAEVTATQMQAYHDSIVKAGHRGPIVLSETAGHSVGGCVNVTDAFVSSLWFVDWLGEWRRARAQSNAQVQLRACTWLRLTLSLLSATRFFFGIVNNCSAFCC